MLTAKTGGEFYFDDSGEISVDVDTIASQTAALVAFALSEGYCVADEWIFQDAGFVEGLNNKVRVFQGRTYGLRDEEYLRLTVLTSMLPAI